MTVRLKLMSALAVLASGSALAQDAAPTSIPAPVVQITGEPAAAPVPAPAAPAPAPAEILAPAPSSPSIPSPVVQVPASPDAPAVVLTPAPAAAVAAPAAAAPAPVPVPVPAAAATLAPGEIGTTIIGDQESPIGLYITPWKDDYAERGLDRPARLLDEAMEPIDPATFRRQIEYYETITEFRRQQRGEVK